MVKIRNVFGDEYKGRQGPAVYQRFYGRQVRRLWDGSKENTAPQQEEQKKRFRVGLAFWESLSREEREALKEYLRGIGSDLTAQQWAVKVALSRPRVTVQQEEVLANLVEWVSGWDAIGWPYRQKITLTNENSEDLTDYQVKLELTAENVGAHFDWSRQGADLRFYDSDGNKLSYWVESWDKQNKQATVWVKVSSIKANSSATVKMYYGNAQAESESDGEAVFDLFDDFEDGVINSKWDVSNLASAVEENGYLEIVGKENTWENYDSAAIASVNVQGDFIAEAYLEWSGGTSNMGDLFLRLEGESGYVHAGMRDAWDTKTGEFYADINGDTYGTRYSSRPASGTMKITIKRVGGTVYIYENDEQRHSAAFDGDFTTLKLTNTRYSTKPAITSRWDYVIVRKYAEQEPGVEFGSEEQGQVVTHTTTRVTVKAIEHVAIADVRVFDSEGNEVWRAEGLTDIASGKVTSRVRLPDEVASKGVRAVVRSVAGTVDVVNL